MPDECNMSFDVGGNCSDSDGGWTDEEMGVDGEDGFNTFPPGEEGILQSHAGGEAMFQKIWERTKPGRGDSRRRRHRVQRQIDSWTRQLPTLVDAYLQLRLEGPLTTGESVHGTWWIEVLGFSESGQRSFVYTSESKSANETLLRHGFIGGSPDQPLIAFSIQTFEIYRQVHRVCPRFSLDGLSKVLSYLHWGPRRPSLAEQLTTAYDAYLAILRGVDHRVQRALRRDEEWRSKNICPPCFYKLNGEAPLIPSWLGCMDGNNSLKLIDPTFRAGLPRFDSRKTESFRWLTTAEVDIFKDEVKNSEKVSLATATAFAAARESLAAAAASSSAHSSAPSIPVPNSSHAVQQPSVKSTSEFQSDQDEDVAWLNVNELTSEESDELQSCVNTFCRHGHALVICDMIRSGELMKYPLAVINRLLDTYGADAGVGYDIMCTFFKTLLRSSMGQRVVALHLRGVVPAFHGHAHNRGCQLGWHPLYVDGVGLEDFEECERTFCLSNNLATVTRHATPFHRQQQIDEHFNFHDADKHAASGNFIFQNYRQATEKIAMNTVHLQVLEDRLHTTAADYELYLMQERNHLEALKREPPDVVWTVEYMELLQKRAAAERACITASQDHRNLDYHIINSGWTANKIKDVQTKFRTTYSRAVMFEEELTRFEEAHQIETRWDTSSEQYKDALVMMSERRYRRALDQVERLVVQRLLEMTKLGASGVAYKLREKIGKALKTRATAIQRALAEYNAAATQLNPPRRQLSWAEVADTVTVAEFDLLRDTRSDIRKLPWADPAC
ncbi:hypothetical protein C8R45DRAFT_1107214 [Mycena sanguinolenta]|nr:hypothetical protein C8R45DRAFT_1107214 [Mycena sanguinolenta]